MIDEYRLPIGCAFTISELFYNVNSLDIKVSNKVKIKYTSNRPTYQEFASAIFRRMIEIIFNDVIETGATFKLPLRGTMKGCIKVDRLGDRDFKRLRKSGYWKDLDIFLTMFTGPMLTLHVGTRGIEKLRMIMCDRNLTKRMIDKCNEGFLYGDRCLDKTVADYYEVMYETFSDVPRKTLEIILKYGWRMLFSYRVLGAEISCRVNNFSCYFGRIYKNRLKLLDHYSRVLAKKLRILAVRKRFPKNDYFYFALTKKLYQSFKENNIITGPVVLYCFFEECLVREYRKHYIFSTKIPGLKTLSKTIKGTYDGKVNLILTKESTKFEDLCVSNTSYMILEYEEVKKRHSRLNLKDFE